MKHGIDIECFSCSGGMAEGFRRAGVTFDFVFDKDPNAVASYTKNLGHAPIQMDVRDLMRMVHGGWSPGPVRLFVADPPCTPWSRAGKRQGLADERDMLRETADLIAALRPQFYLIGNVPGLQDSTSWDVVQDVIGGLSAHGYCVADYVSLDAADYGVPQHRVRPFWFGHLGGDCIRWPAPTHGAPSDHPSLPGMGALKPWVTCREALQHLPLEELGRPVRIKLREAGEDGRKNGGDRSRCSRPDAAARTVVAKADRKGGQILVPDPKHPPIDLDAPSTTVRAGVGGGNALPHIFMNDRHPPALEGTPAPTVGAKDRGQGTVLLLDNPNQPVRAADDPMVTITAGGRGHTARLEWPWDRPSTTIQRDERIAPPGHHDEHWDRGLMSGPNAVVLSERAAAILQGFPDGWLFAGETKKARWSQIGQAMPPPLAEAVARAVVEAMERAAKTEAA